MKKEKKRHLNIQTNNRSVVTVEKLLLQIFYTALTAESLSVKQTVKPNNLFIYPHLFDFVDLWFLGILTGQDDINMFLIKMIPGTG